MIRIALRCIASSALDCAAVETLNLREWTMQEWTMRHHVAGIEFAGVDKSAQCGKGGHCGSGQCSKLTQTS